jgi:hypothetical protein
MLNIQKYRLFLLFALIFLHLAAFPVYAEMRIFTLQHRPADELAETVRALIGDQAKVAAHHNTLVVRATSAEINEVASLVEVFDKPLAMLRISIDQGFDAFSRGQNLSASGTVKSGPVTVKSFSRPGPEDTSVFVSTGDMQVKLEGQAVTRKESRKASQFISVLDGSPASISVGRSVPFTSQLKLYSRRHPQYVESVSYQRVDTGFNVTPHLQGDVVEADIAPFMKFLDQDNPLQIVFYEAKTRVRIPLGLWYDLSQHMAMQDDLSREILLTGSEANTDSGTVRIRIDPQ